jgi:hypothetical protein
MPVRGLNEVLVGQFPEPTGTGTRVLEQGQGIRTIHTIRTVSKALFFFRVPQHNLSIQAPKTCYARSTLVKKTVPQELGTCYADALRTVLANALRTVFARFTL